MSYVARALAAIALQLRQSLSRGPRAVSLDHRGARASCREGKQRSGRPQIPEPPMKSSKPRIVRPDWIILPEIP